MAGQYYYDLFKKFAITLDKLCIDQHLHNAKHSARKKANQKNKTKKR